MPERIVSEVLPPPTMVLVVLSAITTDCVVGDSANEPGSIYAIVPVTGWS